MSADKTKRRYRVRQFNPVYFVAERKGWLFWQRISADGSDYWPEMCGSFSPAAVWSSREGAEMAIKAAEALRDYPKTIWDAELS